MRNLSSTFRHEMYYNSHDYDHKAIITLADNSVLTLTNTELWAGGFSTDDAVSEDSSFTALGSTIIGAAKIIINNIDQSYSDYDFTNAKVELSLSKTYILDDVPTTESIRIGRYTVDECVYNGGTITLSVLDNMEQFDRPYSLSNLIYPATLGQIVQDACLHCGVLLQTYTFPHYNYSIPNRPTDEAITFRQVLGWVATIAGCFARCNSDGKLELKWFDTALLASINEGLDGGVFDSATPYASGDNADGGSFNPWNTGYDYDEGTFSNRNNLHYISRLYSQNIGVDDIVITGIHIIIEETDENNNLKNKEYTFGESGYIIKVEGNKLINKDSVNQIGTWLANAIVGMRFRNVNVTHIDDPSIEAGDIGLVIDRKQNEYPILITRTSYSAGSSQTTVCGAESPSRNSASRFSQITQAYVDARNLLNKEQTRREQAVQALVQALEAKSGLYSTEETAQGGGTIYYLHDKPLLADSKVVWKMNSEAIGVTTDYKGDDTTWNFGVMVNGDVIARILNAIGVNAEWITTGSLSVEDNDETIFKVDIDNKNLIISGYKTINNTKTRVLYINTEEGRYEFIPTSLAIIVNGTAQNIQNYIDTKAQSAAQDAKMTNSEVMDAFLGNDEVDGIFTTIDGRLFINMSYLRSGEIDVGGSSNTLGRLRIKNSNGNVIIEGNKDGIKVNGIANTGYLNFVKIDGNGVSSIYKEDTDFAGGYYSELRLDSGILESLDKDGVQQGYLTFQGIIGEVVDGVSYVGVDLTSPNGMTFRTKYDCGFAIMHNDDVGQPTKTSFRATKDKITNLVFTSFQEGAEFVGLLDGGYNTGSTMAHVLTLDWDDRKTVKQAVIGLPSSKRYKDIERELDAYDVKNAYNIKVYSAKYKDGFLHAGDQREGIYFPMFIAEQMQNHIPIAVDLNEDGNAETWNERIIVPIMFQMIKDQKTQLDNQKEIIDKQQTEIDELKDRLNKIESLLTNI